MASNTLRANQIAMQVVGQNIANANTPGYIRETVNFVPGATQQVGPLLMGTGVNVQSITQQIDNFLEDRLRTSVSDRASTDTQEEVYVQLESLLGELSETDLSTSMNKFFSSIADVLNQPESASVRNLVMLQGETLAGDINRLSDRVTQLISDVDGQIGGLADRINELTDQIRTLNVRIAQTEGGNVSASDAVGLRDQRLSAIEELSGLVGIQVQEQASGGVTIYVGGDYLVYEGIARHVEAVQNSESGVVETEIRMAETDALLDAGSGELEGLMVARDEILGTFRDRLDEFARTMAFEFNKIYSGGQGLSGFQSLTSANAVDAAAEPLDAAGLPFTPVSGSFRLLVNDMRDGTTRTATIDVNLDGTGDPTTLDGLAAALDAVDDISAVVTSAGRLVVSSDSADVEFAFADDTSGILAALGVNVFFTGSTAATLDVSDVLRTDPGKFAASRGGVAADTENAVILADFLDRPIAAVNDESIGVLYDRLVSDTTQGSTVTQAVAEGNRTFEETLRGQKEATSGVSLDEETVRLIGFQRAYQASARYISVLQELFETLVNL